jgi:hypothetical protein
MALSVDQIIDYRRFKILPVPSEGGYFARIKRESGKPLTVDGHTRDHFDTMKYGDDAAAVEQAKLIVDSGVLQ